MSDDQEWWVPDEWSNGEDLEHFDDFEYTGETIRPIGINNYNRFDLLNAPLFCKVILLSATPFSFSAKNVA